MASSLTEMNEMRNIEDMTFEEYCLYMSQRPAPTEATCSEVEFVGMVEEKGEMLAVFSGVQF
ncbi:hypothetical protein ACE2AK_04030 [Rahnella perminowiae]|uniref:hypothetical protein n=1 Tax=Rahnella perminowiae TaxID=2816244 RepID=UPI003654E96F